MLHPRKKPDTGFEPLDDLTEKSKPEFKPKSRGKKPTALKLEVEESKIKADAAFNKLMAQLKDINDKIETINSGLRDQKATLENLVKTDEVVHEELNEEKTDG
jgi:predicted transcriptional regulator